MNTQDSAKDTRDLEEVFMVKQELELKAKAFQQFVEYIESDDFVADILHVIAPKASQIAETAVEERLIPEGYEGSRQEDDELVVTLTDFLTDYTRFSVKKV